jgi:hypothetical protein
MVTTVQPIRSSRAMAPLRCGEAIAPADFARLRRRMILDGYKWDPQVGDISTLAAFPLLMPKREWKQIATLAEQLAAELMVAESELLVRPELHRHLGLPWKLRRLLRRADRVPPTPAAGRLLRFDFHWTTDGWRISEVNSDVPGGLTEASILPRLMADYFPGIAPAGDPAGRWADEIAAAAPSGSRIALLSAPGYMEDLQIMAYLSSLLAERGMSPSLCDSRRLRWEDGPPFSAIVRFYQGEWLSQLPRRCGWQNFFLGGDIPVANPGIAILTESKRFPLVWDQLSAPMTIWRQLLPETRDPRDAPWRDDDSWLIKSAYCNTGDTVAMRELLSLKEWRAFRRAVNWTPSRWVAQRRFVTLPVESPIGPIFPCLGVYTINGLAAGCYVRFSPNPLIDYAAIDIALLVSEEEES